MSGREVVVYKWESGDGDGPPEKAGEFVVWLMRLIETSVPAEFREAATIDIMSTGGGGYDDSSYATFKVAYVRPATAAELLDEQARLNAIAMRAEAYQRAEYERLKRKFGA